MVEITRLFSNNKGKIEITLAVFAATAGFLNYMRIAGSSLFFLVAMLTLASYYFYSSFLSTGSTRLVTTIARLTGIASSVCVVALCIEVLGLRGASSMLAVGVPMLLLCGLVLLTIWFVKDERTLFPLLLRIAVLGGASLATLLQLFDRVNLLPNS